MKKISSSLCKWLNFNLILNIHLSFLIFTLPSNLFFKISEKESFIQGLLIDYLIPKIYLSDLIILLIFIICLFQLLKKRPAKKRQNYSSKVILLIVLSIFIFRQGLTKNPIASLFQLIKIIEISSLAYLLFQFRKMINYQLIFFSLIITLIFQNCLAIYQFNQQKSLFDYHYLGETNLQNFYGIAKGDFYGETKILPYGTTAHPNILAGVLVIDYFLIMMIYQQALKFQENKSTLKIFFKIIVLIISILTFYTLSLTQSISAYLSLFICLFIQIQPAFFSRFKIILPSVIPKLLIFLIIFISPLIIHLLAINFPDNLSLLRRDQLNQAAWQIFQENPFFGTGLNNFTVYLNQQIQSIEVINFIQPAHHLALLYLSETGFLGLLLIFLIYQQAKKIFLDQYWLILLPIAVLDHYLLTQQTGLLLAVSLYILTNNLSNQAIKHFN